MHTSWIRWLVALVAIALPALTALAADQVRKTSEKTTSDDGKYLLRYKLAAGESLRTKVIHQAAVRTSIDGTSQTAETVSVSVKVWQVREVTDEGHIVFVHSVEYVDMKNDVSGRETVRFDSRKDTEPPPGFEDVANRVGVPLSEIVMDTKGTIIKRTEKAPGISPRNQLTMPLPEDPVGVGDVWTFPYDIRISLQSGLSKRIQARQRFEVQKVDDGVASIGVSTQILTPVNDKEVETQVIQHESEGTVRFDIDAGRVVGQQIDLDRRVVGYPNNKSSMHYRTRFTEKLLSSNEQTAARPQAAAKK
jgi:hypothetical protein